MKAFTYLLLILFSLQTASAQNTKPDEISTNPNAVKDSSKKSIKSSVIANINKTTLRINYYSPAVRGRNIWGGLVPYNDVWVTGAHSATNIEINHSISVNGKTITAGKYAVFTIPGKEEWIFIINKNYQQHLSDDYDANDDIIRVTLKPTLTAQPLERLQYFIETKGKNKGTIAVQWEKIRIELPFTVLD